MQHEPHPITRAEFARRAGRGRSRITEAAAPGGLLRPACLPGGLVDAAHPAAQAWAARRGINLAALLEPMPLEALLVDAAKTFAARVGEAIQNGDVDPNAVALVLDALGSLLVDAKRKLTAVTAPAATGGPPEAKPPAA